MAPRSLLGFLRLFKFDPGTPVNRPPLGTQFLVRSIEQW